MIAVNPYTETSLPMGDSPELVLVPATPHERIESIKMNSIEWKGPLDLETYIARENKLSQQRLTRNGLTCWVLVDRREPEDRRTIYSSCETYKKKAILAYNGIVEDVSTNCVGSVYCRPEFRGKGYAKRMIQELSLKIDEWLMESEKRKRSLFSVLFSDIGKDFYAQFGWKPHPSSHLALPPISPNEYARKVFDLPETRVLLADNVRQSMCSDQVLQKERELLRVASQNSSTPKVAIAPDFDHFVWHWAREEFYSQNLYPERVVPKKKGAGNDQLGVYCAWNRNFTANPEENTLYILRWVYKQPSSKEEEGRTVKAMAAILRRAQLEAYEWNMGSVTFWNPTPLLEKAVAILDPTAEIVHREQSSIACLRWSGVDKGLGSDVEWFWNEKYAWC